MTMIRKFATVLLVALALSAATACTRVNPGYAGIKVNLSGGNRGVDQIPLVTGWVFYMPGVSTVFEYPTFVQTAKWEADEGIVFNSQEGLIIGVDISLSYSLNESKVPAFYVKFRSDDLNTFTHGFLRNVARDSFNETAPLYKVDELYGPKKEEFLKKVQERINAKVNEFGIRLDQFGVIGAMRLPGPVVDSLNSKITATQDALRVENELRQTQAEAQKNIARAEGNAKAQIAGAQGQAEANRIITNSINSQLLEWERLKIQGKWDGVLPTYMGGGAPSVFMPAPAK